MEAETYRESKSRKQSLSFVERRRNNLPKKVKRLALRMALSAKMSDGEIIFIDTLSINKPETKEMIEILRNLGMDNKSVLIILPEKSDVVMRSARNIPTVKVMTVSDLSSYDVMVYNRLLITKDAANRFNMLHEGAKV
jgi:large subunit ribosomal protein L4